MNFSKQNSRLKDFLWCIVVSAFGSPYDARAKSQD